MRPEHWLFTIPLRLRSLFRWAQTDQELDDELCDHLERKTQEYVAQGMTQEDAHRRARLDLGGIEQTKEKCRDTRRVNWIQDFVQDLQFGLRVLRKSPGFTVVAVLTLALGIGANTAIFSLVDAVLIRMLPVQRPEQLFRLINVSKDGKTIDAFSYPTFELIQENNQTLSGVIAFHPLGIVDFLVNGKGELAHAQAVSGSYFTTLGVKPIFGRTITTADETRGASQVAVISYGYWTRRFNRDPSVVGAEIVLNGAPFAIIGVTPPEFFGLEPGQSVDVSIPLTSVATVQPQFAAAGSPFDVLTAPFRHWLHLMVRLRDGQTEVQALANLGPIYEQAMRQAAEGMRGLPFDSPSARSDLAQSRLKLESGSRGLAALREQFSKPLALLMAVVGVLLLIACTNVANLLLARCNSRQSEIALRLALGAGRARVLRQPLYGKCVAGGRGRWFRRSGGFLGEQRGGEHNVPFNLCHTFGRPPGHAHSCFHGISFTCCSHCFWTHSRVACFQARPLSSRQRRQPSRDRRSRTLTNRRRSGHPSDCPLARSGGGRGSSRAHSREPQKLLSRFSRAERPPLLNQARHDRLYRRPGC